MIKIAHSLFTWLPQTASWLYNLVDASRDSDINNIVICDFTENTGQYHADKLYASERENILAYYWRRSARKLGLREKHTLFIQDVIEKEQPDILHSHFADMGFYNLSIAKKNNLKHIVSFYGYDVNMLPQSESWRRNYKRLFEEADLFLCEGPHMASVIESLGCAAGKIKIHRLGIDPQKIKFKERDFRSGEKLRILIAGTFREKKGIPIALKALGLLNKEYGSIEITIIGDATIEKRSKDEKNIILQLIEDLGLKDKVVLKGFIPYRDIIESSYAHDLFLAPSITASDGDTEGGAPVIIIEMEASGIPVISSLHCDIPYVLSEQNAPLLAKEGDFKQLAEILLKFANNKYPIRQICDANRRKAETDLNISLLSENLRNIYRYLHNLR